MVVGRVSKLFTTGLPKERAANIPVRKIWKQYMVIVVVGGEE